MTVHIRAIYSLDHPRADVRVKRRVASETTEQLRDEMDNVVPLLRWPIRVNLNPSKREVA